jgi:hypothetical protein
MRLYEFLRRFGIHGHLRHPYDSTRSPSNLLLKGKQLCLVPISRNNKTTNHPLQPYTYPLLTSTLWTFLSFLLLTLSHSHSHPLLSLLSSNLLLIAPLWLTTYLHLVLPYLSNHFLPTRSLLGVRAPVLRALSLLLTVPVAALQVVGMMRGVAESDDGRMWFALGVVLQGLAMVIFVAMLGMLHREVTGLESVGVLETGKREWRKVVWTAYGNAGLVLVCLSSLSEPLFSFLLDISPISFALYKMKSELTPAKRSSSYPVSFIYYPIVQAQVNSTSPSTY